jgi:hypothetical protein
LHSFFMSTDSTPDHKDTSGDSVHHHHRASSIFRGVPQIDSRVQNRASIYRDDDDDEVTKGSAASSCSTTTVQTFANNTIAVRITNFNFSVRGIMMTKRVKARGEVWRACLEEDKSNEEKTKKSLCQPNNNVGHDIAPTAMPTKPTQHVLYYRKTPIKSSAGRRDMAAARKAKPTNTKHVSPGHPSQMGTVCPEYVPQVVSMSNDDDNNNSHNSHNSSSSNSNDIDAMSKKDDKHADTHESAEPKNAASFWFALFPFFWASS